MTITRPRVISIKIAFVPKPSQIDHFSTIKVIATFKKKTDYLFLDFS